ncbi:MAG: acyl-CoA dehydratase activase [Nanobdellota archaeon]
MTLVAGIDIGSTTAKIVLIKEGTPVVSVIAPTGADCNAAAERVISTALKQIKMKKEEINYMVATGYGRRAIDFGNETITEISANARGAVYLGSEKGKVKSILDVGGQDTKAIILDENGKITNFVMNDKCAAGTGRFLDVISRSLQEPMEKFVKLSLESKNPTTINSTCTVFAESEVISLIAKKMEKKDIIAGIHKSIAKRIIDLGKVAGIKPIIFFDGGGAKNFALKRDMENEIGYEIYVPPSPQIVVALGAAIIAFEKFSKEPIPQKPQNLDFPVLYFN